MFSQPITSDSNLYIFFATIYTVATCLPFDVAYQLVLFLQCLSVVHSVIIPFLFHLDIFMLCYAIKRKHITFCLPSNNNSTLGFYNSTLCLLSSFLETLHLGFYHFYFFIELTISVKFPNTQVHKLISCLIITYCE